MENHKEGSLTGEASGCKSAEEGETDFSSELLLGLDSLMRGVNANPEAKDELVTDFKETEAYEEMLYKKD